MGGGSIAVDSRVPVASFPLQSVGRRFLAKFGVAFAWASLVAVFMGGAAFFRVPRTALDQNQPWHAELRLLLERLELYTYDWRARMLGDQSHRSDAVVLLSLDDETLSNARAAADESLSVRPWPRELMGALASESVKEGASVVLFDTPLVDASPRICAGSKAGDDEELMARKLEALPGTVVLPMHPLERPPPTPERELKPWLVRVGAFAKPEDARQMLRRVLVARAPAYRVQVSEGVEVWAGALTEAKARELATALEVKGAAPVRPEGADDAKNEVRPVDLLVELAQVQVSGLAVERLPQVRSLEGPVAQLLNGTLSFGADLVARDVDWSVRSVPLLLNYPDADGQPRVLASGALLAAMKKLGTRELRYSAGRLHLSPAVSVPVDDGGHLQLWWEAGDVGRGDRGTLKRSVPLWRLAVNLRDDEAKRGLKHHDNELEGRVAIVADTSLPQVPTPVGRTERAAVLGQAVANLIEGKAISRVDPAMDFWLTTGLAFTGAVLAVAFSSLFRRAGWLSMLVVLGLCVVLYAGVARQLFLVQGRWVAMAAPLLALSLTFLAALGYAAAIERGVRDFLLRSFGNAIRPEVFRRVESNVSLMKPLRREVAVFFSDLEGFTATAQTAEPRRVVQVLQEYLTVMTDVVIETHGQVDKYLGDGVMAFWGAPVHLEQPAAAACEAALAMQRVIARRRDEWQERCGASMVARAGIDFGEALFGEMGTEHRRAYTGIGEPVATAFRLEGLAKKYRANIVVTHDVVSHAGDGFVFREVDLLKLVRRPAPVRLYELIGHAKEVTPQTLEQCQLFGEALVAYRARRFSLAKEKLSRLPSTDGVAALYLARCHHYESTPPPPEWDGVFDGPESD